MEYFSLHLRVYCMSPPLTDVKTRHYHVCGKIFRQHLNKLLFYFWVKFYIHTIQKIWSS